MLRKIKILFFFVTISISIIAMVYANDYNFRKTNWGMSKKEVKRSEKGDPIVSRDDMIVYDSAAAGLSCKIGYIFVDDKLVRAKYIFDERHSNKNDYIADYNKLKDILIKKYGKPIKDKTIWKGDLYRDDYDRRGFAVSIGDLVYFSDFETPDTAITLILSGDNYDINFGVEYRSKKLEALEEKAKEKETLSNF